MAEQSKVKCVCWCA